MAQDMTRPEKGADSGMEVEYQDLVLLNAGIKERGIRCHVRYKNRQVACLEPPGVCCLTQEQTDRATAWVRDYYRGKGIVVVFSPNLLYFFLTRQEGKTTDQTR